MATKEPGNLEEVDAGAFWEFRMLLDIYYLRNSMTKLALPWSHYSASLKIT